MKSEDLILIGVAVVGGYYLAPKEVKEQIGQATGGVTTLVERTFETVRENSSQSGLAGGLDINLDAFKNLIGQQNGVIDDLLKKLQDAATWAGGDKTIKPIGDTTFVIPSTAIKGGNFTWKLPSFEIGGGGFEWKKPVIKTPEPLSWWEALLWPVGLVTGAERIFDFQTPEKSGAPANLDDRTSLAVGSQADKDMAIKTPSNIERPATSNPMWYKSTPEYTGRNLATPLPVPYQREIGGPGGWSPE
jgi:hypothetical protein